MPKQPAIPGLCGAMKKKVMRREQFLAEMEAVVPWWRLQLHALAYNLATFLRWIELPDVMADWSLPNLHLKMIKIGARIVRHARAITVQLAKVIVTGPMVRAILAAIRRLRAPPSCA